MVIMKYIVANKNKMEVAIMPKHKNEYEIIKELLDELAEKSAVKNTDKKMTDPNLYMKVLQANGALERIKKSTQNAENYLNSVQAMLGNEERKGLWH